ncbi:Uncharacterized 23.2 kDa protein in nuc 5'region [Burkholderia latens]|uniref:DNA-binding protein n=1 Tax=Burkholderia latens TaxID=488446 RepID=UPI0039A64F06
MAISRDEVWKAADELEALGMKVTLASLRQHLGGGSYTTIQEPLKEWKQRKRDGDTPTPEALPPELAALLNAFGAQVFAAARAEANLLLAGERKRTEAEIAELRNEAHEAAELADTLTRENERLRADAAEVEKLRAQLDTIKRKSAEDLHRAMEKATQKDSEAIEARKNERAALDRASRAEGQVDALKETIHELTAQLKQGKAAR